MTPMDTLKQTLQNDPDMIFAVLIGSRAMNTNQDNSDWDIAIQWRQELDFLTKLERIETLRHNLAEQLHTIIDKIDLIDITTTRLAMRAEIADHGVLLAGDNTPCRGVTSCSAPGGNWKNFIGTGTMQFEVYKSAYNPFPS